MSQLKCIDCEKTDLKRFVGTVNEGIRCPDCHANKQPPGFRLLEILKERGIGQIILAQDTGLSTKMINTIVKGKQGISADVALLLEKYLPGQSAEYWLELDYKWRLAKAKANQNN